MGSNAIKRHNKAYVAGVLVSLAFTVALLPNAWTRQHPQPPERYSIHVVRPGESPWSIMARTLPNVNTQLAVQWLYEANGMTGNEILQPGDILNVPDPNGNLTEPLGPVYSSEDAIEAAEHEVGRAIEEARQVQAYEASRGGDGIRRRYWEITLEVTAYYRKGLTYSGLPVDHGVIAVDPAVIPLGSVVWVPGVGYCVALDTGSAIKGARADLYLGDKQAALEWGRRKATVRVLE